MEAQTASHIQEFPEPLGEVTLPAAHGRRTNRALSVAVLRELTPEDLQKALECSPIRARAQRLRALHHGHHNLAQLLALGKDVEFISLTTGYNPCTISALQSDPLFKELLDYYSTLRERVFVDVAERLKVAGLTALDQLQEELDQNPEKWSKREKMEFMKLCLAQEQQKGQSTGMLPGSAPLVSVTFVQSESKAKLIEGDLAK